MEMVKLDRIRNRRLAAELDERALGQFADHETEVRVLGDDLRTVVEQLLLVQREILDREADVIDDRARRRGRRRSLREHHVDAGESERLEVAVLDVLRTEREPDRLRFRRVRDREMNVTGRDAGGVAGRK